MSSISKNKANLILMMSVDYAKDKCGEPFDLKFDDSESVFNGSIEDDLDVIPHLSVGSLEIEHALNDNVSDLDMTAAVVTEFHEILGHGSQILNEFRSGDTLSKVLAMNHFACKSSANYEYGERLASYYKQPKEIAAQYVGLYHTREFLGNVFGGEKANEMVCEYVNYRIKHDSEFIGFRKGKPYENVDDILDEFQHVFEKRVYEHRPLDREAAMQEPSPYADYFKSHEQPMQQTYVSLCRNGVKQDLMMTSIYLYQEDKNDRLRSMYPSLEDVPYAPSEAMTLRYYPSWIHEKDKDMRLMNLISDDVVTADKDMEFD